jgi:protein ImuA
MVATEVIQKLRNEVLKIEGGKTSSLAALDLALGPLRDSLPGATFPLGAVHEFICHATENVASTCGFISGLLSVLMKRGGICLWIGASQSIFPPALKRSGLTPDRFIFVDVKNDKDGAWVMDEALKCEGLTAVVGEMRALDFTASRRFQLAAEQSHVTGFIIRKLVKEAKTTPNACTSRWRVTHMPSLPIDNLPGIGYPQWNVELLKIRNGRTGEWQLMLENGLFKSSNNEAVSYAHHMEQQKKAG